jgi:hypothetical protein
MNRVRKKSGKQSHLHYSQGKIKYQEINLTKEIKDLYNENFKILKKEVKEGTRWFKDLSCSWISRVKTVKMTVLPKVIYRLNAIPIKIPLSFFKDTKKSVLIFI